MAHPKQDQSNIPRIDDLPDAGQDRAADAASGTDPTYDPSEVERFGRLAADWWDPNGKFRPLHQIGPARLTFLRDQLSSLSTAAEPGKPLAGLRILDIGCGGGLIAEPLCRMGAVVTGIDPATDTIAAASAHAKDHGLTINYRACRAEDLVAEGEAFDAVTCLEVVEHVPDVAAFLTMIAPLVRPGGKLIASTINRTMKSYALAIIGAEYILRWLPAGTHQWDRFVTPDELRQHLSAAGLEPDASSGIIFDPFSSQWHLGRDQDVNYIISAGRLIA